MTRIITTPKCLLVEVPEGAAIVRLIGNAETGYYLEVYGKDDFGLCTIQLPPASYGDPVLASEMTEEEWKKVVEYHLYPMTNEICSYEDYENEGFGHKDTSLQSGQSLLRAHSLKPETTVVIPIN